MRPLLAVLVAVAALAPATAGGADAPYVVTDKARYAAGEHVNVTLVNPTQEMVRVWSIPGFDVSDAATGGLLFRSDQAHLTGIQELAPGAALTYEWRPRGHVLPEVEYRRREPAPPGDYIVEFEVEDDSPSAAFVLCSRPREGTWRQVDEATLAVRCA